jgi:hypothetical protein
MVNAACRDACGGRRGGALCSPHTRKGGEWEGEKNRVAGSEGAGPTQPALTQTKRDAKKEKSAPFLLLPRGTPLHTPCNKTTPCPRRPSPLRIRTWRAAAARRAPRRGGGELKKEEQCETARASHARANSCIGGRPVGPCPAPPPVPSPSQKSITAQLFPLVAERAGWRERQAGSGDAQSRFFRRSSQRRSSSPIPIPALSATSATYPSAPTPRFRWLSASGRPR